MTTSVMGIDSDEALGNHGPGEAAMSHRAEP